MEPRTVLIVVVHLALLGVGGWLVVIDARTHRLHDRIVLLTTVVLLLLAAIGALATGDGSVPCP